MTNFKCTVCGHSPSGEEAPEVCPVCGASKEKFELEGKEPEQVLAEPEDVQEGESVVEEPVQETKPEEPSEEVKPEEPVQETKPEEPSEEVKPEEPVQEAAEEILEEIALDLRNLVREEEYHDEAFIKKVLYKGDHETALYCFKPGQEQKLHSHPDAEKTLVVVKGSAEINTGKGVKALTEGDTVFLPKSAQHAIKNNGADNLVVLQVVTPNPYNTDGE